MRLSEWAKANRTGFLIMAGVTILVVGAWALNNLQKASRRRMADELGSIGDVWGLPKANPANTKFAFCQRSENGLGLYEIVPGQSPVLVNETRQGTFNYALFRVLDWTPDGQAFACTSDGKLRTYDPESQEPTDEINIGGGLVNFAWFSPTRIAAFDQYKLYDVTQAGHTWKKTLCFTVTNAHSITGGMAISDHAFAWRQDDEIWMFDFATSTATKLWADKTNGLVDFFYDVAGQRFYVNCGSNGGLVYASSVRSADVEFMPVAKIGRPGEYIFKVFKLNQGYAYLSSNTREQDIRPASPAKNKTLYLLKNAQTEPLRILGEREIVDYSINGNTLLIIGSMTNEPCGLWAYDLASASLKSVWSPLASPQFSTLVSPEYHALTNTDGEVLHYYLWPPVKARPDKKYPAMICQSNYRWLAEAQVTANSGCYFAMAERPTFHSESRDNWPADVKAVHKDLLKAGRVDAGRAFLFGTSAETVYVNELLAEDPGGWKGAFLEGGVGPVTAAINAHPPELACILGDHDEFNPLRNIITYKEAAAKNGVPAKVVVRAGVHTALASSTQREIARLLADFLHDNQ